MAKTQSVAAGTAHKLRLDESAENSQRASAPLAIDFFTFVTKSINRITFCPTPTFHGESEFRIILAVTLKGHVGVLILRGHVLPC
jgi:hypothetical protein